MRKALLTLLCIFICFFASFFNLAKAISAQEACSLFSNEPCLNKVSNYAPFVEEVNWYSCYSKAKKIGDNSFLAYFVSGDKDKKVKEITLTAYIAESDTHKDLIYDTFINLADKLVLNITGTNITQGMIDSIKSKNYNT